MGRLILRRVLLVVPVLVIVSIATFAMVMAVPRDPAVAVVGPNASAEAYQQVRDELGLDEPVVQRYASWLGGALHGDLGRNLVPPVERVSTRLARAFPINLELAVLALAMALAISVPLAMISAYRPDGRADRAISFASFTMISVPSFLAAILLALVLSVTWRVFPLGQWARPTDKGWAQNLYHAFLPALTLALPEAAIYTRVLRTDLISTLQEDYILAARSKGLPTWHLLAREALRPSSFSLVTLAGLSVGRLIGGTIIVERVFSLPGVGSTIVEASTRNDYPLVQGGVLVIAVVFVTISLLVDILYHFLDPRLRRAHTS